MKGWRRFQIGFPGWIDGDVRVPKDMALPRLSDESMASFAAGDIIDL
jgi:hypothetical protein